MATASRTTRAHARCGNPLHEMIRFDATGISYYDPLEVYDQKMREDMVAAKLKESREAIHNIVRKQRESRNLPLEKQPKTSHGSRSHHRHSQRDYRAASSQGSARTSSSRHDVVSRSSASRQEPSSRRHQHQHHHHHNRSKGAPSDILSVATSSRRIEDGGLKPTRYGDIDDGNARPIHGDTLRPWINLKDDRYNTEHTFPHVYTGFGVPSKLKVTATGPVRGAPGAYTTTQDSWKWEPPDPDVYLNRKYFRGKGGFTDYLRESIRKHVNLMKTAH
mmetsp:Transcript_11689/g.24459  ORF Transcript_11689/g.24459 Transcript_11689/m.24459 type:complete len:276 (-) Transcript_11689:1325-2152(-)